MNDMIDKFDSWKDALDKESRRAEKEKYERFLKIHLDVLSVTELFRIIGKEAIISWINQFEDEEDQNIAFSILKKIKYYSSTDVTQLCQLNFSDWIVDCDTSVQNTVFVPLGGSGKSGSMIGYMFRMANSIPKDSFCSLRELELRNFVFDENITDIVLLDDYSGTGDQFSNDEIIQTLLTAVQGKIRISFLPVVISRRAIERINKSFDIKIYCHQIRGEREYTSCERAIIKRYGKGLFVHHDKDLRFGWGDLAETIVFFYNVPNNSLPIIWASSYSQETNAAWKPLFSRVNPNGDNEIEQLFNNIVQLPYFVSEDYPLYFRVFTEMFILLRDKRIRLSFQDLYRLFDRISLMMYPYELPVDYHSPFVYLQKLRIKMLKIVKETIIATKPEAKKLIDFFAVDYPIIDQGCLICDEYSAILSEFVISKGIELCDFVDVVDREMDGAKRLVYLIEGFMQMARKVINHRGISDKEKKTFEQVRMQGKNTTIKFWISTCVLKEKVESRKDIKELPVRSK